MRRTLFSFVLYLLSSLIASVLGKYADMVISAEKELAESIDDFALENHLDVYHFIAKTYEDTIIVQIRFENDSVGIEGYFSETSKLNDVLEKAQKAVYQATVLAGLEGFSDNSTSLELLQAYRFGLKPLASSAEYPSVDHEEKRAICRPCRECLRDLNNQLEKKASRCGQFCSVGANCITPGCTACYYTGGECRWQKSCQIN
ncbi:uncharacterized protein L201_004331 [Kwoniella dendrophila CBS 6074]|uniref:Uncharacterized protein n=1 Tax=Kwoniella dendrophila CBS 6074 TaxID=1295534 RepID=A0AAX4JVL6_9TREE